MFKYFLEYELEETSIIVLSLLTVLKYREMYSNIIAFFQKSKNQQI